MKYPKRWLLVGAVLLAVVTGAASMTYALARDRDMSLREYQCVERGWQPVVLDVAGRSREVLWKGPAGAWPKGAIIALHGGGGEYDQWCGRDSGLVGPQVRFSELAVELGFAVFLVNSSDDVSDEQGRRCGKIWDDQVRDRPNLDLPFLEQVMRQTIPAARPVGSVDAVFLTGLSSGGYMTVRAATHFNGLVSGFAPVSSGDPYGWHRVCEPGLTPRVKVQGAGYDNETGKQIVEQDACRSETYPNERAWDDGQAAVKPSFRMFHHEMDGINDISCADKVVRQLRSHGYASEPDFLLRGGRRGPANHLWQDEYNRPILDFFAGRLTS